MTDGVETVNQETPIKTQPIVELGKPRAEVTIADAVNFILQKDFDPRTTTYEFPVLDQHPLSYDGLRQLSGCNKCEVAVMSIVENDNWTTRVMTGGFTSCGTQSLLPFHSNDAISITTGQPIVELKVSHGYPILNDAGQFTGELWEVDIHNHPTRNFEGPPYPSMPDVRNAAANSKTAILLSNYGLTVYGRLGKELNLPEELKSKIHAATPLEVAEDGGAMLEVGWYVDRHHLTPPDDIKNKRARWTSDKVLCDLVGVKVKVLKWDEDRAEIERLLTAINDRTFDSQDYLEKNADPSTPID